MELPTEVTQATPGLIGSLIALLWIKDTWPRRIAFFAAGAATSYYGSPFIAKWTNLDKGLAGFLVGLLGMAIAVKVFETLAALQPGDILRRWMEKKAGL
jgi:hypothetical protein